MTRSRLSTGRCQRPRMLTWIPSARWCFYLGSRPSNPQTLVGDYVKIAEISPPVIPAPTETSGNFLFDVDTDGFAATNAYYHVESLFRLMNDLGFGVPRLFANTAQTPGFPLFVGQSGFNNQVNAQSPGNIAGNGSGGLLFGRAAATGTVGIAADFQVVAHEFCHALFSGRPFILQTSDFVIAMVIPSGQF
jgi:hypothetical protein